MTDPNPSSRLSADSFTIQLAGRDIEFRAINEVQLNALARITRRVEQRIGNLGNSPASEVDPELGNFTMTQLGRILDMIQAQAVREEDQEFLETAMLQGKISLMDLQPWFEKMHLELPAQAPAPKEPTVQRRKSR
jgi:hypothetical protein